jgi:hypothetical protein
MNMPDSDCSVKLLTQGFSEKFEIEGSFWYSMQKQHRKTGEMPVFLRVFMGKRSLPKKDRVILWVNEVCPRWNLWGKKRKK